METKKDRKICWKSEKHRLSFLRITPKNVCWIKVCIFYIFRGIEIFPSFYNLFIAKMKKITKVKCLLNQFNSLVQYVKYAFPQPYSINLPFSSHHCNCNPGHLSMLYWNCFCPKLASIVTFRFNWTDGYRVVEPALWTIGNCLPANFKIAY
jgi:hypothetical protein